MDMPLEELAGWVLQDPSETIEDGETYCGRGGGSLDTTSGILTLTYIPEEDVDHEQRYGTTTVRFVEIEKLLDALGRRYPGHDREDWRLILTEVLDAHEL